MPKGGQYVRQFLDAAAAGDAVRAILAVQEVELLLSQFSISRLEFPFDPAAQDVIPAVGLAGGGEDALRLRADGDLAEHGADERIALRGDGRLGNPLSGQHLGHPLTTRATGPILLSVRAVQPDTIRRETMTRTAEMAYHIAGAGYSTTEYPDPRSYDWLGLLYECYRTVDPAVLDRTHGEAWHRLCEGVHRELRRLEQHV
jgi:hypothetical protein